MDTQREKRLMEAFAQYESGVALATLQTLFSDVAVELNQMVEAEQMLAQGKAVLRPSKELGRKVVAALALQQRRNESSVFMSKLWRFAAPVGVAALSFMFVLAGNRAARLDSGADSADMFVVQEAAPMMAKNIETNTMLAPVEQVTEEATEPSALRAVVGPDIVAQYEKENDALYLWQMTALGLLVVLSIIVLVKHWLIRRRSF